MAAFAPEAEARGLLSVPEFMGPQPGPGFLLGGPGTIAPGITSQRIGKPSRDRLLLRHAAIAREAYPPNAVFFPPQHIDPVALEILLAAVLVEQSHVVYPCSPCSVVAHEVRLNRLGKIVHHCARFEQALISFDYGVTSYQYVVCRHQPRVHGVFGVVIGNEGHILLLHGLYKALGHLGSVLKELLFGGTHGLTDCRCCNKHAEYRCCEKTDHRKTSQGRLVM